MTPAQPAPRPTAAPVDYPSSDGERMAENTVQYEWIVTLKGNLDHLLHDTFVAGDLLWYPIEGDNRTRVAPDVMVAFGRPKGHRPSWLPWREEGVHPQVVIEVWSPGNTWRDKAAKLVFYERHGVDEFLTWDPDTGEFAAFVRGPNGLDPVHTDDGWTSPRLGCHFVSDGETLHVTDPDGRPFQTFEELKTAAERLPAVEAALEASEAAREASEAALEAANARAAALAAKLAALGIDPEG